MNDNTPFGMTNEEFKTLIDKYIERGSQNTDDFDLEADMFFDALAGFMEGLSEVILEVKGTWHNGHFTLTPKGPLPRDVAIVENRIALPGMTFIIQPEDGTSPNGNLSEEELKALVHQEQIRFM